mgnify:CR=1 FL=1
MAGLTDWNARNIEVKLDFLEASQNIKWKFFKDGVNADVYASDYKTEEVMVSKDELINIIMAKGGGWAAILTPVE